VAGRVYGRGIEFPGSAARLSGRRVHVLSIVWIIAGAIAMFTLPIAQYPQIAPPTSPSAPPTLAPTQKPSRRLSPRRSIVNGMLSAMQSAEQRAKCACTNLESSMPMTVLR